MLVGINNKHAFLPFSVRNVVKFALDVNSWCPLQSISSNLTSICKLWDCKSFSEVFNGAYIDLLRSTGVRWCIVFHHPYVEEITLVRMEKPGVNVSLLRFHTATHKIYAAKKAFLSQEITIEEGLDAELFKNFYVDCSFKTKCRRLLYTKEGCRASLKHCFVISKKPLKEPFLWMDLKQNKIGCYWQCWNVQKSLQPRLKQRQTVLQLLDNLCCNINDLFVLKEVVVIFIHFKMIESGHQIVIDQLNKLVRTFHDVEIGFCQ